ncbi:MAG: bifunctional diaminohydroxyphosphoribosylaminopyrimidine deaminase/5-amino-6-(5-phosphoribosylamino)uracil reductase RibD [Pseudomonadota bacterium]
MSARALNDADWMAATARLAERARAIARPNPGVAALIVKEGRVIARGWTQEGGRPHAEAMALAGLKEGEAKGATIYVTLEPCAHKSNRGPACSDLLSAQGPARVVIGQHDPDPRTAGRGVEKLNAAGIATAVLEDAASARSLDGYLMRMREGRPFVTLKLALSLDGRIALGDGTSQWITGPEARAHCHAQRARNEAILVGGGTWRADAPRLDARLPGLEARSPDRVVLTRRGAAAGGAAAGDWPEDVRAISSPDEIRDLDGVSHLYIEGGAQTAASFLKSDLVDELHLYRAPILIGGDGLSSLGALGLTDLASAHGRWEESESRALGSDRFTAYRRLRS